MAVKNTLQRQQQQPQRITFSSYLNGSAVKAQINSVVGVANSPRFMSAIVSAVNVNPALQECSHTSILSAALLGETLKLSPSPQLGQYYMVPFNDKDRGKVAQFILGYKGYIQLALRSGQYRKLNVLAIKEGELVYYDPLNEEIEVNLIQDEKLRESTPTIGYYAFFEYLNGFRKSIYWSTEKMIAHADKFSPAFSVDGGDFGPNGKFHRVSYADYLAKKYPKRDEWMYSSFWYKDFDAMAYKTMLRQLIGHWGIMSIDLQRAYEVDNTVESDNGQRAYVEMEDVTDQTNGAERIEQADAPAPAQEPVSAPAPEDMANEYASDGSGLSWD